jgi:hypothetical protein
VKATVWAQGQACGFALAVLGLSRVLDNPGRGLAGPTLGYVLLSLAVGCRPFYLVMVPLFVVLDWRTSGRPLPRVLGTAALAMAPYGALLAAHNWARFGDPLEFGHNHLPWARALPDGLFSLTYLPRNAGLAFLRLPDVIREPPYLVFDPNGTAFWLNNGILLVALCGLVAVRFDAWVRATAGLGLAAIGLAALLYASTGWRQFGYRYFIDLLPAAAVVFLYAYRRWTPLMTAALACSLAANLFGLAHTKTMTRHAAAQPIRMEGGSRHSQRSATTGSTAAARRAGKYEASNVVPISTRHAPASAAGSVAATPKRNARSGYPAASDSGTPTTSATAASRSASPTTMRSMVPRWAPKAMRTPISRVRRLTVYARVP